MLPTHWIFSKLGEVCQTTSGGTPSRKVSEYYKGSIPWVKSGELNYNVITETEEYISEIAVNNSSAKVFPKGTLLIALYGATIGKLAFLGVDAATNQAVCAIFKNKIFESRFLYYLLFYKKQDLIKKGVGGAQPNISQTILKNIEIPIVPLPEQRAIVSRIEQLFSDLDNGIANLRLAQEQLKVYRQAVLKKAFEGKLTRNTTEIPQRKLSDFAELITKGASPKWQGFNYTEDETQLLFITSENVREGFIDLTKKKFLPLSFNEKQKRSTLRKGDVLFNLVGASIGRAAIFNIDLLANVNQAVALIRLSDELNNWYLTYFLNAEIAKQEYLNKVVDVARANLSLADVNNLIVPYCSLSEQHAIVEEIETRLSVCDKMAQDIDEALEKAEALRQSILKKAFEGKLLSGRELAEVRSAEDWEPAEVLLERIRAERVGNGKK